MKNLKNDGKFDLLEKIRKSKIRKSKIRKFGFFQHDLYFHDRLQPYIMIGTLTIIDKRINYS